jgi:hypothetical protein
MAIEPLTKIAASAGVRPRVRSGYVLFTLDDSRSFLEACSRYGVLVHGFDGFEVHDDWFMPEMGAIADFSGVTDPQESVVAAMRFLEIIEVEESSRKSPREGTLMFDFTTDAEIDDVIQPSDHTASADWGPFQAEMEIAASAGLNPHVDALLLFTLDEARAFLEACLRCGAIVLGVDGWEADDDWLEADNNATADFSGVTDSKESVALALRFLENTEREELSRESPRKAPLMFDFTIAAVVNP